MYRTLFVLMVIGTCAGVAGFTLLTPSGIAIFAAVKSSGQGRRAGRAAAEQGRSDLESAALVSAQAPRLEVEKAAGKEPSAAEFSSASYGPANASVYS
mgnify:CR=1 FL=1